MSYFALTTLSTIGYGDMFPITPSEQLVAFALMVFGIVFFSQIMGSFIEIIKIYASRMGGEESGSELNTWMQLLNRFTTDKLLPVELTNSIDMHYSYQAHENRLSFFEAN